MSPKWAKPERVKDTPQYLPVRWVRDKPPLTPVAKSGKIWHTSADWETMEIPAAQARPRNRITIEQIEMEK